MEQSSALSNFLEMNISALDEAIDKLDRKMNHKKFTSNPHIVKRDQKFFTKLI